MGTLYEVGSVTEKQFPLLMGCRLPVRYEENQLNATPYMPYHIGKGAMRMFAIMSLCTFKRVFLWSDFLRKLHATHWISHLSRYES